MIYDFFTQSTWGFTHLNFLVKQAKAAIDASMWEEPLSEGTFEEVLKVFDDLCLHVESCFRECDDTFVR